MLAVAATCLVAALVGAPTAGAASSSSASATAQAAVSKKKLARDISSVRRRTNAARRSIRTLGQTLAALQNTVNGLRTSGEGTQGQVNGILAAVPQVLDGLTQLRDGSLALKAGLETLAAKTTEGFGKVEAALTRVGTFATSQEYGIIGLFLAPGGGSTCCRLITAGTADIPDDGNPVSAGGQFPVRVVTVANPQDQPAGTVPPDSEVFIHAAIRSAEGDGTGADDPAGQVGGLLTVKCASIGGCGTLPIGPPPNQGDPPSNVPIQSGDLVCAVGPTPNSTFQTPAGEASLGLVNVPLATERSDQTQPAATTSEKTVNPLGAANTPETDAGASATGDPAANSADKRCTLPNNGIYEVTVQTQFVDIPTSEDPAADD